MLRENSKTRRALWRVDGKAEDVGLPAQVKDDRACVPLSADAMIVIGDSSSSNTRKLYEICKTECQETFYIQTLSGLELDKLESSDCIGITAGASTPNNIIEEVYTNVRRKLCTDVR